MAKNVHEEIKKLVADDKVIIGADRTLKLARSGDVAKVFLAANSPEDVREDLERYGKLGGFEVVSLDEPNTEVGAMLKKPFPVAVFCTQK